MSLPQEIKLLAKEDLYDLLRSRFDSTEKKLSQIPNPSLLHEGERSAKRIAQAIQKGQKITLVGDYDVDGVSATAIVVDFFRQIPYPLEAIIPNRFDDGYGVSPRLLERIDADLIITVDNGITAIEAAKICKDRKIDLIITDHHTPFENLPDAYSIIDPKLQSCSYPFADICGAQVAWLLLGLLKKELKLSIDMKQFLDILTIAIIADIMPLIDINRSLVKEGLKLLSSSTRPSSIIIRDFLNKRVISAEDIAFQIAPRINSAGRLEDASIALEFFIAQDTNTAYQQFEILNQLNEFRKETEAQATKDAIQCVDLEDDIIVVAKEGWHEGVVGIVASRLVDYFAKPAIVLSINKENAKGSARSIAEVNIYELLKKSEDLLTKFGGHKMAAGLGCKTSEIQNLRLALNESAKALPKESFIPKETVLGTLASESIDYELLDLLESFEPYGESNPRPTFFIKDAEILTITPLGKDKNHCKILLRQFAHDSQTLELILFRQLLEMPKDRKLTCSYTINKNEFNSRISIQLLINKIYN